MKPSNEAVQNWRRNQIAKGLCRYCKRKAVKGKTMCRHHLEYFKWRKRFGITSKPKKKKTGEKK
jgi:hypothetical protein